MMKIGLAADHAGFEIKNHSRDYVRTLGFEVLDLGAFNTEPEGG